jgi:hypothetical protein
MGATTFITKATGKTAKSAFKVAIKEAQYHYGHSGYTGTIAEKQDFIEVTLPKGEDPVKFADKMIDDPRFDDKWGPAGCVKIDKDTFLFFGWASN